MKTNEDIARWCETRAVLVLDKRENEWLRAAAAALRGLDAQTDADNSVFHVAFDTATKPGSLVVTTVRLGVEVVGEQQAKAKRFNIGLCNHPSYENLRQYIIANPEPQPNLPASLTLNPPETEGG